MKRRVSGRAGGAGAPVRSSRSAAAAEDVGRPRTPEVDRIVFFSDAVFAIALTLLVVRIDVPRGPDFAREVLAQWPRYLSYTISFLAVGLYWVSHHRVFRYILRWDEGLIALNLFLLLFIAFIPYPAAMIGEHGGEQVSLVFYAATLAMAGLANLLIWMYATRHRRLVAADLDPAVIRRHRMRGLVAPVVFFASIPLSFVSMDAAYYSWVLVGVALVALHAEESATSGVATPRRVDEAVPACLDDGGCLEFPE
jgi:uncharacterized membrane protein